MKCNSLQSCVLELLSYPTLHPDDVLERRLDATAPASPRFLRTLKPTSEPVESSFRPELDFGGEQRERLERAPRIPNNKVKWGG